MKTLRLKHWIIPGLLLLLVMSGLLLPADDHPCGGSCPIHAPDSAADVLLADFPPETVLASVNGNDITLREVRRHREGKRASIAPGQEIQEAALLELMIRRKWLAASARAQELDQTDAFRESLARFRDSSTPDWMTKDDLVQRALADTFLEQEVIARMDVQPEEIEQMYALFKPTLPEDTTLEEARPLFENHLRRQAVERYIRREMDPLHIVFHNAWIEYVSQAAARSREENAP